MIIGIVKHEHRQLTDSKKPHSKSQMGLNIIYRLTYYRSLREQTVLALTLTPG